MEYSSSEDDELVEDFVEHEEDTKALDAHQQTVEAVGAHQLVDHGANHMILASQSIGSELLTADGDMKNQDPYFGMEFTSDSAARTFYYEYASRMGFGIRVARSRSERRKGIEVLVMKRFVCLKEGHHKKKVSELSNKKKRKRLSIRDGCPAMMEVVRRGPDKWVVTKVVLEHTHVVVSPERVREIQLSRLSGKDRDHQNHLKEMRRKVFGDSDAQFLLEYFKKMQAENSGFFYAMQVDNRNCMTNVFWADAKARMSYTYFGDAVTFDTTYKQNKNMMPFAAFTGVNNHGQTVVFGCALIIDETESSFTWLFETWLTAMSGQHPSSLTTDQGKAIAAAVMKVFPATRHRLCRWCILSRCKKKLYDVYSVYPSLHDELKACVNESDTAETFEAYWNSITDKYNLRENTWLQSLYDIRDNWVPAYHGRSFFAELSTSGRVETLNRFCRNNFLTKVPLQMFIAKFDQEIDARYEREAQEDFSNIHSQQILKTESLIEKQAADIYTRYAFEKFQSELVEALDHFAAKVQDGPVLKYSVGRSRGAHNRHTVLINTSERKALCSCYRFEIQGMLCRHVLCVLLISGDLLPEQCILKRWTKKARAGTVQREVGHESQFSNQNSPILRYNEIFHDALKVAERGATSPETYKIAKAILHKAFAQIISFKESPTEGGLLGLEKV